MFKFEFKSEDKTAVLSQTLLYVCVTLFVVLSVTITMSAQQAATKPQPPAPLVAAPPPSPDVHPDGSVSFRLVMANAVKVELHLEGSAQPFPMTKEADGAWTVTVPKLAPQYYSYSFNVDGSDVLDPHNTTIKTSFFSNQNIFLMPGQPPMPWEPANVPHGIVHHHYYHSSIVGVDSQYFVYTPPGFDPKSPQEYPVLYLLHGYSDDPSAWTHMGKANVILDNLIASGKAKPMIVVMPLGYGTMDVITHGWQVWKDQELIRTNYSKFGDTLFKEVMPLVKQQYPLSEKREDHAIAGLSMGGAESLLVGLNHVDDFAYVGGFSSAPLMREDFAQALPAITAQSAPDIKKKLRVLWISCGTEDGLIEANRKLGAWLKEKGIEVHAVETPGMHVWMLWRDSLSNFAPMLFQEK